MRPRWQNGLKRAPTDHSDYQRLGLNQCLEKFIIFSNPVRILYYFNCYRQPLYKKPTIFYFLLVSYFWINEPEVLYSRPIPHTTKRTGQIIVLWGQYDDMCKTMSKNDITIISNIRNAKCYFEEHFFSHVTLQAPSVMDKDFMLFLTLASLQFLPTL